MSVCYIAVELCISTARIRFSRKNEQIIIISTQYTIAKYDEFPSIKLYMRTLQLSREMIWKTARMEWKKS